MFIDYSAPRGLPQNTYAPNVTLTPQQQTGLNPSQYEGLQQYGDQNLYFKDGQFYEAYSPSPRQYGRMTIGGFSPVTGPFGMPYQPSYSPIFGYGGGIVARGGDVAGTIRVDDQAFKPYTGDVPTGFSKTGDDEYQISMVDLYNKNKPNIQAQPNTQLVNTPGYTPASIPSLSMPSYSQFGNSLYGLGRFLGGNNFGLNFGAPSAYLSGNQSTGQSSVLGGGK